MTFTAKTLRNYQTLSLYALSKVPRGTKLAGLILPAQNAEFSPISLRKLLRIRLKRNPLFLKLSQWVEEVGALVDAYLCL